jgi:methionyl-tRNA formyltransferase
MKLIFAGTPENAALGLELVSKNHEVVLVITRKDAEVGRKRVLTPSAVARKAEELGLPVLKANRVTELELAAIKAADADLALVIAYGSLIPQSALDQIRWWNIHFSLLPLWRGATPLQQSIRTGGVGAGVTLFELDAGMDTGPVIAQIPIELGENESTVDALPRFTTAGIGLFEAAVKDIPAAKDQQGEPSFAPKLDRAAARLDLSDDATTLHRAILAFNPEPMAWCELDGQPIRILKSRLVGGLHASGSDSSPGRISKVGNAILMECGGGTLLELSIIQPAGKQPMAASDWFRGLNREVRFA